MAKTITLKLTEDEAEIISDALETDLEGYVDAMKEARGNNNRADVQTFTEAAERVKAVLARVHAELGPRD
jgi:flagellar capping protein FliD